MQVVATPVRVFFVLTTFLFLFTTAKAQQPVQIESDAGVISMVATVDRPKANSITSTMASHVSSSNCTRLPGMPNL
jgi:hypothetical protein